MLKRKKTKQSDPIVDYDIYDEVTKSIYSMQNELSKLIGEDVRINTFSKQVEKK